ncbi:MAG: glutaredoxin [Halieaceae bacterium]|nr:glutaredoxin [Halieaceae bacterium]
MIQFRPTSYRSIWKSGALIVAFAAVTSPVAADWLITLEGKLIETRDPWTIDGDVLTYIDLGGEQQTLALDDVDLEASEETTALRSGKPYLPREQTAAEPAAAEPAAGSSRRKTRKAPEPEIILYMTSLCKECARARKLLEELGVAFVQKDIIASSMARREYKKKAGHGGGLPVIDIGGALVFSNNPRVIRQRVRELEEKQAEAAKKRRAP